MLRGQSGRRKQDEGDERRADQVFTHLGIASFATLLPLGLLFIKPGNLSQTLRQLAPLISVFESRRLRPSRVVAMARGGRSGKTRTAATSLGLIGSLISLAALIFAWPNPVGVIITASINCAVYLAVALASSGQAQRYDLRLAHAGAIAHFSLASLTVANLFSPSLHWWSEDNRLLAAKLFSTTSGHTFALLFALFAAVSEWLLKKERKIESRIYGISAVVAGALGFTLISAHGFRSVGDPHHAALSYAFYALAAFVIAWRREKVVASWVGSALSLLAVTQTLAFKFTTSSRRITL